MSATDDERAALEWELELLDRQVERLHTEDDARSLLAALPCTIVRLGPDGTLKWRAGTGNPAIDAADVYAGVSPGDVERVKAEVGRVAMEGGVRFIETIALDDAGTPHTYATGVAALPGPAPHDLAVLAVEADEMASDEERLRESEMLVRLAKEVSGLGVWTADPVTGKVAWDDTLTRAWGGAPPERIDEVIALIHPDDAPDAIEHGRRAVEDGSTLPLTIRVAVNGMMRTIFSCGTSVRDAGGRIVRFVGGALDLTHRRVLEERLALAQRLESLASVTTGLALALEAKVDVLLAHLGALEGAAEGATRDSLGAAHDAGRRASALIAQLRLISGQGPSLVRARAAPATLVDRVRVLAASSLPANVALVVAIEPETPDAPLDVGQLEQAVFNLVLNARDALAGGGGTIRVVAAPATPQAVRVLVADDGPGMDSETVARALEPFFTTKPEGQGTGLGLATAYAIVRAHGGDLRVESAPGRGTTVTLELPLEVGVDLGRTT